MKHGSSRRQRNRGGSRRGQPNKAQVYDSNGPDVRIRGTAYQVHEKYVALAKDSAAAGDDILAESYLQHAEHYQRIINEIEESRAERQDRNKAERGDQSERSKSRSAKSKSDAQDKGQAQEELALPGSILGEDAPKTTGMKKSAKATVEEKELESAE